MILTVTAPQLLAEGFKNGVTKLKDSFVTKRIRQQHDGA